jgi:hypothetical protein
VTTFPALSARNRIARPICAAEAADFACHVDALGIYLFGRHCLAMQAMAGSLTITPIHPI